MMPGIGPLLPSESRRLTRLAACTLLVLLLQSVGPVHCGAAPEMHRTRLANGAVVLFRANPAAQTVGVSVCVDLPASLENARSAGIRSLLARMLLQRRPDENGHAPLSQLAEMGAVADTGVRQDCLVVNLVGLAEGFAEYLPPLREIIFGGDFDWERMPAAKMAQLHTLTAIGETSDTWAQQLADGYAFRGTPYAWPVEGTSVSVQAIGQRELRQLHQAFVRPNNCVIAVSGPLNNDGCVRAIASALGSVLPGPEVQRQRSSLPEREAIYIHRPWAGDAATVLLSARGPAPTHGDFAAVQVMWAVLAGGEGSRLWRSLRGDAALTYSVGAEVEATASFSVLSLRAQCDLERAGSVYGLISEQLRSAQQSAPTPEETRRAVNYVAGNRMLTEQHNLIAAETLALYETLAPGEGPELLSRIAQNVVNVTPEDVRLAASRYLRRPVWVQLGGIPPRAQGAAPTPRGRLGDGLAGYSNDVLPTVVAQFG
ncbi:MAG TPA: hypothetical protein DGT21_08200 [Armatimonadetes bacterium]|jgi:predicted Zn-dependent peptidase|nr:hypothetical protein [Armatimonadota bacterium]